jgi:rubrerythrin
VKNKYKTDSNIQEAFGGESKANRRYLFFAAKAEKEGFPQVARLFRAVAEAETIHARNHLNALDAIGTTKDNLTAAVIGEHQEFTSMYPTFIELAKEERNDRADRSFSLANAVEKIHHGLFEVALAEVKAGKKAAEATYYVCQICGNTICGSAPDKCTVCGAPKDRFIKVE